MIINPDSFFLDRIVDVEEIERTISIHPENRINITYNLVDPIPVNCSFSEAQIVTVYTSKKRETDIRSLPYGYEKGIISIFSLVKTCGVSGMYNWVDGDLQTIPGEGYKFLVQSLYKRRRCREISPILASEYVVWQDNEAHFFFEPAEFEFNDRYEIYHKIKKINSEWKLIKTLSDFPVNNTPQNVYTIHLDDIILVFKEKTDGDIVIDLKKKIYAEFVGFVASRKARFEKQEIYAEIYEALKIEELPVRILEETDEQFLIAPTKNKAETFMETLLSEDTKNQRCLIYDTKNKIFYVTREVDPCEELTIEAK